MKKKEINGLLFIQDLIKLRWIPEILKSIDQGNSKYSDILNSIPYMSHTELNRKLAVLIDRKVIEKVTEENENYYTLLNFGEDLVHIFEHLEDLENKYFTTEYI